MPTASHKPTIKEPRTSRPVKPAAPYKDEELVTVLHGYGRVSAKSVSWLDDYRVIGGVIRNVPYGVAKQWKSGARPDGRKAQRPMNITILPQDAPEADFARAAGVSVEDQEHMAAYMTATDADALLDRLPKDKLVLLRMALDRRLTQQ